MLQRVVMLRIQVLCGLLIDDRRDSQLVVDHHSIEGRWSHLTMAVKEGFCVPLARLHLFHLLLEALWWPHGGCWQERGIVSIERGFLSLRVLSSKALLPNIYLLRGPEHVLVEHVR
jgi:hypothetical protein